MYINIISKFITSEGTFKLTMRNKLAKNIVTFMWYSNNIFSYMFKAEFVTLVSLKGSINFFKRFVSFW